MKFMSPRLFVFTSTYKNQNRYDHKQMRQTDECSQFLHFISMEFVPPMLIISSKLFFLVPHFFHKGIAMAEEYGAVYKWRPFYNKISNFQRTSALVFLGMKRNPASYPPKKKLWTSFVNVSQVRSLKFVQAWFLVFRRRERPKQHDCYYSTW